MAGIILKDNPRHPAHPEYNAPTKAREVADKATKVQSDKDYESGFETGKNRQQLKQDASASKKAGYAAGLSTGNGATATSPFQAFNAPEPEPVPEPAPIKVPERKIESNK